MKKKDLIQLGFERQDVGTDNDFYYYTLDIEDFCLITNGSDEVNGEWKVYIFDYNGFEFTDLLQLVKFINILKSAVKIKDK